MVNAGRVFAVYAVVLCLSREGWIRTPAGERALRAGYMYLIPSGLKFDYWCDGEMDKLYIHVALELPDGFDLLGGFADGLELELPECWAKNCCARTGAATCARRCG